MMALPIVAISQTTPNAGAILQEVQPLTLMKTTTMTSVMVDSYGNPYTGKDRTSVNMNINGVLVQDDRLTISGLVSGGIAGATGGVNYGRVEYEIPLVAGGTSIGGSYSLLQYTLGGALVNLRSSGVSEIQEIFIKQPIIDLPNTKVYGMAQYDHMKLSDHIDMNNVQTDRSLNNLTLTLAGEARDALFANGVTTWAAGWKSGRVSFENAVAQMVDSQNSRTNGQFSKLTGKISHVQSLSPRSEVYFSANGQVANTNLDVSEKMAVGGPFSVRAYDIGSVFADSGYQATVEYRYDLGSFANGKTQAVVFLDTASVKVSKNPMAGAVNTISMSGAGVGLNWTGQDQWRAKLSTAARIGGVSPLVTNTGSVHTWVEVSKGF